MRNYKQFISGVIVGGLLLSGGNVLANNSSLPSVTNWVKYKFNGEEKQLSSEYTTLNYEGHTYVPARFIAEELGAEVDWDDNTKTVLINKETVIQECPECPQQQEQKEEKVEKDYEALPVSKTIDGVRVEIYSVEQTHEYTKFYLTVKNTTENLIQLNQEAGSLKTDENELYEHKDIKGSLLYWKDVAWFNDIREDDEVEGYIMVPHIPDEIKQGEFYIEVVENGLQPKVLKYNFDVKWN